MREPAASIVRMSRDVETHSRDLGAALVEQQRLTREVHHRVKNSLQIISSLLSLHARGRRRPKSPAPHAGMQARVGALTMVHRWAVTIMAYAASMFAPCSPILPSRSRSSLGSTWHSHPAITVAGVGTVMIGANVAVPVAFLVTELAHIAMQAHGSGDLRMAVDVRRNGDTVTVELAARAFAEDDWIAGNGAAPSARIVTGMMRQLRGTLQHDAAAGSYAATFEDEPLEA